VVDVKQNIFLKLEREKKKNQVELHEVFSCGKKRGERGGGVALFFSKCVAVSEDRDW
jgi:hypothetical protein